MFVLVFPPKKKKQAQRWKELKKKINFKEKFKEGI